MWPRGRGNGQKIPLSRGPVSPLPTPPFWPPPPSFLKKGRRPKGGKSGATPNCLLQGLPPSGWEGISISNPVLKRNSKKMAQQYREESRNTEKKRGEDSSFASQVRAFHYLKKEQEAVRSNAKKRLTLHSAAAVGYGTSLGLAVYESIMMGTPKGPTVACMGEKAAEKSAEKSGLKAGEIASQVLGIGTSPQIAVVSGIMLGWNVILLKGARQEKKRAEENIKKIDKIIAGFQNTVAGYCPDGREDLNNERCYCYTDKGIKNPQRSKSAICQNLWKQDEKSFYTAETDYTKSQDTPGEGCLTTNLKFDRECRCRNMKNTQTGENACYKFSQQIDAGNLPPALEASETAKVLDDLASGTEGALGKLSAADLSKKAAKKKKLNIELLKKARERGKNFGPLASKGESLARKLAPRMAKAASHPPGTLSGVFPGGGGGLGGTWGKQLQKAAQKAKLTRPTTFKGGKGLSRIRRGKKNSTPQFSWDAGSSKKKGADGPLPEGGEYDFRESDVVTDSSLPIWKIISNRYQISGLKRLFENKKQKMNELSSLLTGTGQKHLVDLGEEFPCLKIHHAVRESFYRLWEKAEKRTRF